MKKETKNIVYDQDLQVEAYQLKGYFQPFPMHFHEYYVIGFIESGKRHMVCKSGTYDVITDSMILFNPYDQHQCSPMNDSDFDYRAVNIPKSTMAALVKDITGDEQLPVFTVNTMMDEECVQCLKTLYRKILAHAEPMEKEEDLVFLITRLLEKYTIPFSISNESHSKEVQMVCTYMEEHSHEKIKIEHLCSITAMSSSTLLRCFTKTFGVTPYRYLEMMRLQKAKKLLEEGFPVVDAAMCAGFCDQSHFTNFFQTFIGISPGTYRSIFIKDKE